MLREILIVLMLVTLGGVVYFLVGYWKAYKEFRASNARAIEALDDVLVSLKRKGGGLE